MENVVVTKFEMVNDGSDENDQVVTEKLSPSFESVNMKYTIQADDHSAGDEHEVEFDIVAGA